MNFPETVWFQWILLPLLIFSARILDVTIGTLRIVIIGKGIRKPAVVLAFFEVLIWLIVIHQIIINITNFLHYAAYAAGFATGTYIGMCIEERLSLGNVLVRVITAKEGSELAVFLRSHGYRVTDLDAESNEGHVRIIFLVEKRKNLDHITGVIKEFNPNAVYTVEDVRSISDELGMKGPVPGITRYRKNRKGK